MRNNNILGLLGLSLLGAASSAQAGVVNGDFETGGLTGWIATGGVSVSLSPFDGTSAARLGMSSGRLMGGLDGFFGLTAGSISSADLCFPYSCINGNGMYQSVSVSAGAVLIFDWQAGLETFSNDVAFLIAGDDIVSIATGRGAQQSGKFSYTFGSTGIFNVGFGIMNGLDFCCNVEYLYIDNVTISSVSVPEPGTLALLGLGLVGVGLRRRMAKAS
jgi:hypothetical protein